MITSETFYKATCDANGCGHDFPDDDWDASHLELGNLKEAMAEERGEFEEAWTLTDDGHTYCPRHKPGNIDCTSCRDGMEMTNPDGATFEERGWHTCPRCDGRGYLTPAAPDVGAS